MTTETYDDGRNPQWPNDSVAFQLWEAVIEHGPLSGPDVGRLRLALDTLADADDLQTLAKSGTLPARDTIAAYAGVRAARKAASDLVAALTNAKPANPVGRPAKPRHHGHRPQRQSREA